MRETCQKWPVLTASHTTNLVQKEDGELWPKTQTGLLGMIVSADSVLSGVTKMYTKKTTTKASLLVTNLERGELDVSTLYRPACAVH